MMHDAWCTTMQWQVCTLLPGHPLILTNNHNTKWSMTMAATVVATTITPSDPTAASKYYFSLYSQRPDNDGILPIFPLQQLTTTTATSTCPERKLFFSLPIVF